MTHSTPQGAQVAAARRALRALALALAGAGLAGAGLALAAPPAQARDGQPRRDIRVTGQRPGASCAPLDYACLNAGLKAAARAGQPAPRAAAATEGEATVPSKAGTFSFAATAQRMGKSFGHAARAARPGAPTYSNPVRGARPR